MLDSPGIVAVARSVRLRIAPQASCYITLAPASFLDLKYAVFGKVTEGIENAQALRAGDKMITVTIE